MSINVKRFIIELKIVALLGAGILCGVSSPAGADVPKVTIAGGQIVLRAAPGTSENDVRALAENAKCDLVRAVPYCPDYYLLRLKSYAGRTGLVAEPITDEVNDALTTLRAQAGVIADPNYIVHLDRGAVGGGAKYKAGKAKVSRAPAPPSGLNVTPNDPLYPRQWGLPAIRMPEAWAIQFGAKPIVVGVADTGIDVGHPDFALPDGTGTRIVAAKNFATTDPAAIQDTNGHGTHTAGTVAATTNNNTPTGVASVAGWNRNNVDVRVTVARVFEGETSTDDIINAGIGYLIDQKVNVISLSLGGYGVSQLERDTIQRAITAKIIVVASAGNAAVDNGQFPHYPSDLPGVIKVTAIGPDRTLAFYSNYGGPVAVTAPGGSDPSFSDASKMIWSTYARGVPVPGYPATDTDGYQAIMGTSMACPHVSGVVALVLAAGGPQDPARMKTLLQTTAQPLDEIPNPSGGNKYGSGLVDAYSAVLPYSDPPFSVSLTGPVDRGTYFTSQTAPLQVTAIGVSHAPGAGAVKVKIFSLPDNQTAVFTEGTDFTIPRAIPSGQPLATPFTVSAPASGNLGIGAGRYKAVLTVNDVPIATQFFDVASQTQPRGRTLFAYPFRIREVNAAAPERTALGTQTVFSLARYLTNRISSDPDYAIFQSSGGTQDKRGSFSATDADGSPLVYESGVSNVSIAPVGLGYWLDLNDNRPLNTVGSPVLSPVYIKLYASNSGWNMIGAPFTGPSGWGTLSVELNGTLYSLSDAIKNNILGSALVGYENGDYAYNIYPNGQMEPFHGYWVRALRDCRLIVAPTSSNRSLKTTATRRGLPTVEGWRARLSARVAGDVDGQNYFGQAKGAADGTDALDVLKPPAGGGHSYLRFVNNTDSSRAVSNAFDMRAADSAHSEWTAAVSADKTNAEVTVSWENLGGASRRANFLLTDAISGQKVDMKTRSSYTFRSGEAGSTRYLKITMTQGASAGPLAINNVSIASGRSAAQAGFTVRFNTTAEAEITGTVKALNGKALATLSGATRSVSGTATVLRWDGRSNSGATLAPGPYLIEITARTADGQSAKFLQPVQNVR